MSRIPYSICMVIYRSAAFTKWFESQSLKIRDQIAARLDRIQTDNHFGMHKSLGDGLWELKFNNGNRIYYTIRNDMFLILGGNKNGQQKDINKAKKIIAT